MMDSPSQTNKEIIGEIYRNATLGLTSISDVLPSVKDEKMKEEFSRQNDGYERLSSEAARLAKDYSADVSEPSPVKKAMMWSATKMNVMSDDSPSHIAEMMVQGTVMGSASLKRLLSESESFLSSDVKDLLHRAIALEEEYEKRWKEFL